MRLLTKENAIKLSFNVSLLILAFAFFNVFISSLFFIFHISISPLNLLIASLMTVGFGGYLVRKDTIASKVVVAGIVLLTLLFSLYIASITSDDTIDAHGYHETAVGAMRFGWNPLYQHIGDFNKSGQSPIKLENTYYEKWDNHYPKAHWIFAANIYSVTGKIETGRTMVLLVMFALFFIAIHYALTRFSPGTSFILAVLAALNPISVMQIFSYYNDGLMGNLLLIIVIVLTMLLDKKYKKITPMHYALISMALALMINLKFTGPVYAGVVCLTYLAFTVVNKNYRHLVRPLLITGAVSVVVGVFIIGLSTYPKNFIEKGSLFYPLIGGGSTDIITDNEPKSFHGMKNVKKFFISNFSETDNISDQTGREPALKVPFTLNLNELQYLNYVDPRIAGYGVWFGGALLISITWLVYLLIDQLRKKDWKNVWQVLLPLVPIALIVLVVSEAWWARYLPQLFLVPAVAVISMLLMKRYILANVLMFALLFNMLLTLNLQIAGQVAGINYNRSEEKAVNLLLENGKYTPKLYLGPFNGLAYRYYERYGKVIILPKELEGANAKNSLRLAKNIVVYR